MTREHPFLREVLIPQRLFQTPDDPHTHTHIHREAGLGFRVNAAQVSNIVGRAQVMSGLGGREGGGGPEGGQEQG